MKSLVVVVGIAVVFLGLAIPVGAQCQTCVGAWGVEQCFPASASAGSDVCMILPVLVEEVECQENGLPPCTVTLTILVDCQESGSCGRMV